MSNLPAFDPLNPSPEEDADMLQGYMDGLRGQPAPDFASIAYEHGRRNAVNDRARTCDADQLELARRLRALPTPIAGWRAA